MTFASSVHTHTTLCDGRDTPQDMARAAAAQGLAVLGFSGHSYVPHENYGTPPERMPDYIREIRSLQKAYAGRLDVLCGVELDPDAPIIDLRAFDYVIGSLHAVRDEQGRAWTVDSTPEHLAEAVKTGFHGDALACVRAYYAQLTQFVLAVRPTIVGHFDLITKFCEKQPLFDMESAAYRDIASSALDALIGAGLVLEVNTGAMARGWRTSPYPADFLLRRMAQSGARVTLTADAHAKDKLTYGFEDALHRIKQAGFASVLALTGHGFIETPF